MSLQWIWKMKILESHFYKKKIRSTMELPTLDFFIFILATKYVTDGGNEFRWHSWISNFVRIGPVVPEIQNYSNQWFTEWCLKLLLPYLQKYLMDSNEILHATILRNFVTTLINKFSCLVDNWMVWSLWDHLKNHW